jgi:hypothetical protein
VLPIAFSPYLATLGTIEIPIDFLVVRKLLSVTAAVAAVVGQYHDNILASSTTFFLKFSIARAIFEGTVGSMGCCKLISPCR